MESKRPVILTAEIWRMPKPVGCALSYRVLQRLLELNDHVGPHGLTPEALAFARDTLPLLYRGATAPDPVLYDQMEARRPESKRILATLPGSTLPRSLFLCVYDAIWPTALIASNAIGKLVSCTWDIKHKADSKEAERIVKNATFDDFKVLRKAFEAGKLQPMTPVDPDALGPLYKKGPPDWARYTWRTPEDDEPEPIRVERPPAALSGRLPGKIKEALAASEKAAAALGTSHTYFVRPDAPLPPLLADPKSHAAKELAAFYAEHDGAALFASESAPDGVVQILPVSRTEALRQSVFEWSCAYDQFDPQDSEFEPLAPPKQDDMFFFADVLNSPNAFALVTAGACAGQIVHFDHEMGIVFWEPLGASLAEWLAKLPEMLGGDIRRSTAKD